MSERGTVGQRAKVVWGMLYADDVGIVSKSAEGSAEFNDASHRDCLRSSKPHSIGKEDGNGAVTYTELDIHCSIAHNRSSWPMHRQKA